MHGPHVSLARRPGVVQHCQESCRAWGCHGVDQARGVLAAPSSPSQRVQRRTDDRPMPFGGSGISYPRTVTPGTSICQVGSTLSSGRSAAPRARAGLPRSIRRALWTADGASPCRPAPTGCQASRPKSTGRELSLRRMDGCRPSRQDGRRRPDRLSDQVRTAQICRRGPSRIRSCLPTGDLPVSRPPSHQ